MIQRQVRHQAFQLGVLVLQLFELPNLFRFQSRIPLLPPVERLLSNSEVADEVGDGVPISACLSTATICSTLNRFRLMASSFPILGSSMPETLLQIGIKIGGPTTQAQRESLAATFN